MAAIAAGGGRATIVTVADVPLTASMEAAEAVMLTDEKNDVATVAIAGVCQSNGIIHVIDQVLLPS